MPQKSLFRVGWRYLLRHPWQSALMILGITLGVAVIIAVDIANASAARAFELSTEAVTGKATHQISAGSSGVNETIYTRLRTEAGLRTSAPVISEYVTSSQLGGQAVQLLGVDPFAESPFRGYLGAEQAAGNDLTQIDRPAALDFSALFVQPGAVLLAAQMAEQFGLQACTGKNGADYLPAECNLTLAVGGRDLPVHIVGLLEPGDTINQRALNGLILSDIATAQELTGRFGRLDRIDLILSDDCQFGSLPCPETVRQLLPPGVLLQSVSAQGSAVQQMTAAFRINLTALSLLALVVGMFLIYNTMTFSVVQRRPLFGTLRCLGVTRGEVFLLVVAEAWVVGLTGGLLGVLLGVIMGQGAVRLVTQTINDLFFVVTVRGVQIPLASLGKGLLIGLLATLATAALPAWEAASVPPRLALYRSGLEAKARRAVKISAAIGSGLIVLGAMLLLFPTKDLVTSFAATFAIIVGAAMWVPLLTGQIMRPFIPILGAWFGSLGRMAPRGVIASLSRTSIAVMALMVAISVTIGVSLMVSSFRNTVQTWLQETLQGDIYISIPGSGASTPTTAIDATVIDELRQWPGVERTDVLRSVSVDSPFGSVHIAATDNYSIAEERIFLAAGVDKATVWQEMLAGGILVSEPFANRNNLPSRGGTVALITSQGLREFPVLGIYYDYASSQGTILMPLSVYQTLWNDPQINAVALRLQPGMDADVLVQQLQQQLTSEQNLLIRPNGALRREVLAVFDRTFAITGALQLLATVVAFIGVLSALLSLELERQRELGILRAVGMTVRQLWSVVLLETGLLGFVAGILALPVGYLLSIILIYIINRRSFGWTLQMELQAAPFLEALLIAILAAVLAGLYPAYRMGRMVTSEALRSE